MSELKIDSTNTQTDGLNFSTSEGHHSILILSEETNKITISTSYGNLELPEKKGGYDVKDIQRMLLEACEVVGKSFPSERIIYTVGLKDA